MTDREPLRRTIRGGRPFFFSDAAIDKVLNMVVTLAGEVWALRERLAAVEGIGVRQGSLSPTEVDDYEFTAEQDERLGLQRKEFIESLFRVLQEQVDAAASNSSSAREQAGRRPGVFGARISSVGQKKAPPAQAGRRGAAPAKVGRPAGARGARRTGVKGRAARRPPR